MAKYFTLKFYFRSPPACENKLAYSLKYFAISHSDSCTTYIYTYYIIILHIYIYVLI